MRLSAKTLKNVENLNTYAYSNQWIVRQDGNTGEQQSVYLQLVDLDKDSIRYIPSASSVITVTFPDLEEEMTVQKTASFPFADDRSILKIDLTVADVINSGNIKISITEIGRAHV